MVFKCTNLERPEEDCCNDELLVRYEFHVHVDASEEDEC
jgi:hypothetical protein